jgi:hypothetical protein
MRRTVAIAALAATLLLGGALAWALTPDVTSYQGHTTPGSHQVLFGTGFFGGDLHAVQFSWDSHQLFSSTQVIHDSATGTWSFHTHDAHWRVKGHWVQNGEVHGSICDLVKSPHGCPDGEHLQTYVAISKLSIKKG